MTSIEVISLLTLVAQCFLVYFARRTIRENEIANRKRAIVDVVMNHRNDKELMAIFRELYQLRESNKKLSELCNQDEQFLKKVLYALDTMEFIAVGIRLSAFDEGVYKQLQCSKVIKTWDAASGLVMELRREKKCPTLYQDLENLANKWSACPIVELKKQMYK
nr:MAG TPA: protein of unknown function (DUF4760) [Caudoviricetes sp.]